MCGCRRCTMRPLVTLLLLALLVTTLASAIPKPDGDEHKTRVVERDLSDQEHYNGEDEEHKEHNAEFDHEAFLGREDAQTFDQLSPEESQERLGIIYDKIDRDDDGEVTETELREWIKHVQNRYIWSDTERQWLDHEVKEDTVSWEDYKKRTYGYIDENAEEDEDGYSYKDMLQRDQRRWVKADQDSSGGLSKQEFADFLHPEDAEHMRDIVIDETLADIDKDKDGRISISEYIGDMWPNHGGDEEPDWVKTEREQFTNFRDKNHDGFMDREEVQDWILPPDYDHSEAEAKHLMYESDVNRDGHLTKEEVVNKYDLFVGSQATDFGEALTNHDEF